MQRRDGWKDSGITLSHGARGGAYETPAGNALYAQILGDGRSALHPWGAPGAAPATH